MKIAALFILAGVVLGACSTTSSGGAKLPNGCTQKYSQIYQPPIKLGGAGRVIQVPSGYDCPKTVVQKKTQTLPKDPDIDQAYMREIRFTSLPAGAFATVFEGKNLGSFVDKTSKPLGGCTTPCTMKVDGRKPMFAFGEMAKGKGELLPIAINPSEKKGIELYFSRIQPIEVKLSTLSAKSELAETAHVIYDKDALPLVRPRPIFPYIAKRGGSCDMVFDVTANGIPTNIRTTSCDNYAFTPASIASVAQWKYKRVWRDGKAVIRKGVEAKVTFVMANKNGGKIK